MPHLDINTKFCVHAFASTDHLQSRVHTKMHRAETLIKTVDLSQTTNICTKYYLLYLPCSDIGIRQSPPYHDLNMEEKGNYEENLKLKTSTADCLLKDFCLAQRFILFYLKVLFSLSQRCLFNKFYPFFFSEVILVLYTED